MASSPTDPGTSPVAATELLRRIQGLYDTAITRLEDEDLTELQELLDRVDALTHQLPESDRAGVSEELMQSVQDSHGRLLAAMAAAHTKARGSIQQASQGRKALRGYGGRSATTGSRHESLT